MEEPSLPSPCRIWVAVTELSPHLPLVFSSTSDLGGLAVHYLSRCHNSPIDQSFDSQITLIFEHKARDYHHLVFDIYHYKYSPMTGHLPSKNELQVWYAGFHRRGIEGGQATPFDQDQINLQVALAHNAATWQAQPPFAPFRPPGGHLTSTLVFRRPEFVPQAWSRYTDLDQQVPEFVANLPVWSSAFPSGPRENLNARDRVSCLQREIIQSRKILDLDRWNSRSQERPPWVARFLDVDLVNDSLQHKLDPDPTTQDNDGAGITSILSARSTSASRSEDNLTNEESCSSDAPTEESHDGTTHTPEMEKSSSPIWN